MTGQLSPPGQVVETEIHLPNGTIKRQIEATNPHGIKTVTTTIEHPPSEGGGDEGDDEEGAATEGGGGTAAAEDMMGNQDQRPNE